MHPNAFTRSPGRCKAATKPETASVLFRAADHPRNAEEITGYAQAMLADGDALAFLIAFRTVVDALGAFDRAAGPCDASTGPQMSRWLKRLDYSIFTIERTQCQI
jgi:hypothetical protein